MKGLQVNCSVSCQLTSFAHSIKNLSGKKSSLLRIVITVNSFFSLLFKSVGQLLPDRLVDAGFRHYWTGLNIFVNNRNRPFVIKLKLTLSVHYLSLGSKSFSSVTSLNCAEKSMNSHVWSIDVYKDNKRRGIFKWRFVTINGSDRTSFNVVKASTWPLNRLRLISKLIWRFVAVNGSDRTTFNVFKAMTWPLWRPKF